jgi:hypothetical protein
MRPLTRRISFVLGTLVLCGLSLLAGDPAWDIPLSIIMATATYLTAPYAVSTWLARRVTARSVVYWLGSTAATFDIYQIARTGSWHPDWTVANLAASTVLYVCAGLVWTLDTRRYWLPIGGALSVAALALMAWVSW